MLISSIGRTWRVAAAGSAALEAEDWAKAGLPDRRGGAHADPIEPLREADRRRRLAFAQRRRSDRRDDDLLAIGQIGAALVGEGETLALYVP